MLPRSAKPSTARSSRSASKAATDGPPLHDRVAADPHLPPDAKLIVRTKLDARDSATEGKRVATWKALDDDIADSMRSLATSPSDYAPGTFARIASAYDTAGEHDKAEATRRLAAQEAALVPFAQASVGRQQRLIDDLPEGEFRDAALAIQRHQAAAFAKDAFAAGTTLYPNVGPPASIDDIKGRLQQARHIAEMRSISVTPYTADETAEMRRILAEGSPDEQQAVRAPLEAMPEDIRETIESAAPKTGSEPPPGTSEAPPPDSGRSTGDGETDTIGRAERRRDHGQSARGSGYPCRPPGRWQRQGHRERRTDACRAGRRFIFCRS